MKRIPEKTIIQTIQPYCDDLLPTLRQRKDAMHVTYQDIADATGIHFDFIRKYFNGQQKNPSIYNVMAICIYLDVSLDAHFHNPTTCSPEAQNNAEQTAEIRVLNERLTSYEKIMELKKDGLKKRTITIYGLIILCALLSLALIGYLSYDISSPAIGFIQDGRLTPFAWVPILLSAAGLFLSTAAVINAITKNRKK